MGKFTVANLSDELVMVGIEPWADSELLKPRSRILFEYDEPANVDFSITRNNTVTVSVMSDVVKVVAESGERIFEQPPGWGWKA